MSIKKNKAIVTLIIGEKYQKLWKQYAQNSWEQYARKYGYDLICFDQPLDNSERASKRSPSWQKCLILGQEKIKQYDQVVWIDSDVVINNTLAPDITENVPLDKVGAVDAWSMPNQAAYQVMHERRIFLSKKYKVDTPSFGIHQEYYTDYGLEAVSQNTVQCGILVLSPHHHKDVLEYVYYHYEDKGSPHWHYEMRPLSYELIKVDVVAWLDYRFNLIVEEYKMLHFPFMYPKNWMGRAIRKLGKNTYPILSSLGVKSLNEKCINATYLQSYFLHFAGAGNDIRLLNKKIKTFEDYLNIYGI
jgi:hypothetical protein